LALEELFKKLQWEQKGIKMDGSFLNDLRLADDIVIISSKLCKLTKMLHQLTESCKSIGTINISKTILPATTYKNRELWNVLCWEFSFEI